MRLLFLTSRLPYPPNRGDRLRVFRFLECLSREHEIQMASFVTDSEELKQVDALRAFCKKVHVIQQSDTRSILSVAANMWRREPMQLLYYRSRAMHHLVSDMASGVRFDAAYVHLFRMAPYATGLQGVYRVVDLTDAISKEISLSLPYRGFASRLLYRFEARRIAAYECRVAASADETWVISEADREVLASRCPGSNLRVVTNGVDLERFQPQGRQPKPNSLIFVGHMGVFHNIDAATYLVQEVLPLVRRVLPDCTISLVGADPVGQVQRLAEFPSVRVTGYVADLNACLNEAALFVAPLRFAAGVQNKVLEAMAAGLPVVTTSIVNKGLGARAGEEIAVADTPEMMSRQIVGLLSDDARRARIGAAGREFVRSEYSWNQVLERMRAIESVLPRWRPRE